MRTLRDAIPGPQALASREFSTIRLRLLKIAVRIKETASRIRLVGVCRQLSGSSAVPRAGRNPDAAPDVSGGACAPAETASINLSAAR
jgi:hypothetical protein